MTTGRLLTGTTVPVEANMGRFSWMPLRITKDISLIEPSILFWNEGVKIIFSVLIIELFKMSLLKEASAGSGGACRARNLVGGGALIDNVCGDWKNVCGCELFSFTI